MKEPLQQEPRALTRPTPADGRPWQVEGALPQLLFAAVVALVAFGLRLAIDPWLGNHQPFTVSFGAIAIAAWFAGWRPGLVAAIVSYLLANYFLTPPRYELSLTADEVFGAGSYVVVTALILLLAGRLERADRALRAALGALRRRDDNKTEFLAVLGHELRNPLSTVRIGLELLKTEALEPQEQASAVAMMDRQLAHVTQLVDDLIDVARIDQGRIELRLQDVPVVAAVSEATAAARAFTGPLGQGIGVDIPPQVDTIRADPGRVSQVLVNLLHNASKFSPRGSRITIVAEPLPGQVAITVRDSGVGIPPERLGSIFERYVQLPAPDGRHAGLGLGLALVRKLVLLHGGSVQAHSEGPGSGSSFTVVFPRGEPSPAALPPARTPREDAPDPLRVLVVDDNDEAARSLARLLQLRGHAVHTALDGRDALRQAALVAPQLVFIDLGMAGMDGFEVARRLRQETGGARPTLVALTGWGGADDQQRTRAVGFDLHLTKPVTVPALERALQACAERVAAEAA